MLERSGAFEPGIPYRERPRHKEFRMMSPSTWPTNITNRLGKDNQGPWARGRRPDNLASGRFFPVFAGIFWLVAAGVAKPALAIPVAIAWQVPLNDAENYLLEVARDPGFGQVVLSQNVRGTSVRADLENEGVYHWRLTRQSSVAPATSPDAAGGPERSTPPMSEERSSFVSGSFALVDAASHGAAREHAPRLTWPSEGDADRYKLYVSNGGPEFKSLILGATTFVVNNGEEAMMIEVVPYTGGHRTSRSYHFNPGLALDTGRPSSGAAPIATTAPTVVTTAGEPLQGDMPAEGVALAQAAAATEAAGAIAVGAGTSSATAAAPAAMPAHSETPLPDGASAAPSPDPAASPATAAALVTDNSGKDVPASGSEAQRRVYLVAPFVVHVDEAMEFQKLDLDLKSRAPATGGGAMLATETGGGLLANARGSYYEFKDDVARPELFGATPMRVREARYDLELAIGYDLLHEAHIPNHLLALAVMGVATQLPLMPLRYEADDFGVYPAAPALKKRQMSLFGGAVAYGYFGRYAGGIVDGGYVFNNSEKASESFARMSVEIYPTQGFVVILGGTSRKTVAARCDPDAGTCLAEGKVHTTITDLEGLFGVGAAL